MEMQMKTAMRYLHTPVRMQCLVSRRQKISTGEGGEKGEPLHNVGGNVN
jgi:hypothetical protein